ncbi:M23 family metallopeptidase [Candidatus Dependentiae bacterium]|nr:M23 family metallopeptidase [Candidatus Dependentiae bacterium]
MIRIIKWAGICCLLLLTSWIGWRSYNYFFDETAPVIEVVGLSEGGYYAGDLHTVITGSDAYKVATISVWLDQRSIVTNYKINARTFEQPLPIPTRTIPDGKHVLRIEAVDAAYNRHQTSQEINFFVDNKPLQAAFVRPETEQKVFQGRTFHVQFQVNKPIKVATVHALSREFSCHQESQNSPVYECFIPVSCEEAPNEYPFTITIEDRVGNNLVLDGKFQIMAFPFKKQQLYSINTEKFAKERELGREQQELATLMAQAIAESPAEKLWHGIFYVPINMTGMVCEFGTKRISQEKGFYIHDALDLVAPLKSVVWAPQDGKVVVKDRFAFTGNTVVIDHGFGVLTMLCHLDSFATDLQVGKMIRRGTPVGRMGRTGYATGDHLHWELCVGTVKVDPMQWTKSDF